MLNRLGRRYFCTAAPQPWLFVGLGNPGNKYKGTRHNVLYHTIHLETILWTFLFCSSSFFVLWTSFKLSPFLLVWSRWGLRWLMFLLILKELKWARCIAKLSSGKACKYLHTFPWLLFLFVKFMELWYARFRWWSSCFSCKASNLHEFEWWICKWLIYFLLTSDGILFSKKVIP